MAEALYAAKVGSAASASTPNEFVNSMTERIQDAFSTLPTPQQRIDCSTNPEQDRDRRRILVAAAQGAAKHPRDHQRAFRVAADSARLINIGIQIGRTP